MEAETNYKMYQEHINKLQELCVAYEKLERNLTFQLIQPEPTTQELENSITHMIKEEAEIRQEIKKFKDEL